MLVSNFGELSQQVLLKRRRETSKIDESNSGTNRYFNKVVSRFGIEIDMVDPTDLVHYETKIKDNTAVSIVMVTCVKCLVAMC